MFQPGFTGSFRQGKIYPQQSAAPLAQSEEAVVMPFCPLFKLYHETHGALGVTADSP